ncbi:MAG: tetratricopeptide repeat protein [Candidatus Hydrogenedentales bacterium]
MGIFKQIFEQYRWWREEATYLRLVKDYKVERNSGRLADAMGLLEAMCELRPDNAGICILMLSLLCDMETQELITEEQRRNASLPIYRRLIQINPEEPEYRHFLAIELHAQGDIAGTREVYEDLLRLSPNFAPAYVGLAMIHAELNEDTDAARCFEEALRLDPHDGDSAYFLGQLYAGPLDDPRRARHYFQRCLQAENPSDYAQDAVEELAELNDLD